MNNKPSANLNQIFIGKDINNKPIFVNMDECPHMLITGAIRTGKSMLLQQMIINLIKSNPEVEFYLCQISKNDLSIFNDYKQVKYNAKTLQQCNQLLKYIANEIQERSKLINIDSESKLSYTYLMIDDYGNILENISDTREERELKKQIIKQINYILQVGHQVGCFVILSSITFQDLFNNKFGLALIGNKVTTRIDNSIYSRMLLDTSEAKDLKKNEYILLSNGEKIIVSNEINIKSMLDTIKEHKEKDHKSINLIGEIEIIEKRKLPPSYVIKKD